MPGPYHGSYRLRSVQLFHEKVATETRSYGDDRVNLAMLATQKPARLILLNPSPEPTALGLPFFDRTVRAAFAWNRHECPALLPRGYSITRLHLALAWLKALFAAAKEV